MCLCICELTHADNSDKAIQWGFLCLSQYLQVADHEALSWSVHFSVIRILQFGVCFFYIQYIVQDVCVPVPICIRCIFYGCYDSFTADVLFRGQKRRL